MTELERIILENEGDRYDILSDVKQYIEELKVKDGTIITDSKAKAILGELVYTMGETGFNAIKRKFWDKHINENEDFTPYQIESLIDTIKFHLNMELEPSSKSLYNLYLDCGRMGTLEGTFLADREKVQGLIADGETIHFGEVLGKHSDVSADIDECVSEIVDGSVSPEIIKLIEDYGLFGGINPMDFLD